MLNLMISGDQMNSDSKSLMIVVLMSLKTIEQSIKIFKKIVLILLQMIMLNYNVTLMSAIK